MRSSDARQRAYRRAGAIAVCAMLAACVGAQRLAARTDAASQVACASAVDASADARARALALQRFVEAGPLYTAATRVSAVSSCSVDHEAGAISITYTLRDGSSLQTRQDPRIEYRDQEARFTSPLDVPAVEILQRAERAAYGANGCGIDWQKADERTSDGASSVDVFRGEVCNCQGRVSRDKRGQVTGLTLRSAC